MQIVLGAIANDPDSSDACDFAVVDLTSDVTRQILRRMDSSLVAWDAERQLHEVHFWGNEVTFFRRSEDDRGGPYLPRDASQFRFSVERPSDDSAIPTEYEHMVISLNSMEPEVSWRARAKYSPIEYRTCTIPRSAVAEALADGQQGPM